MIDVIIPAYRGLAQTRRCVESVLASRVDAPHEVVVIDDASPEPALAAWLCALAAEGRITLLTHTENRGFVATVNEGMALHPGREVVLLNSDTEVADGWLDRLAACAASAPMIGTVTPFSNNATICSYPGMEPPYSLPEGIDLATLDRFFREENAGLSFPIPTGVGFCLFIRRPCLDAIGPFDEAAFGKGYGEEVDFCLRAAQAGWENRLAADTFVFHEGAASFGHERHQRQEDAQRTIDSRYPAFRSLVQEFVLRDPAAPARERVAARVAAARGSREAIAPSLNDAPGLLLCVVMQMSGEDATAQETLLAAARQAMLPELPGLISTMAALPDSLRAAMRESPGRDVVLLAAGARLPFGWDARFRKALQADAAIGAVSPMVPGDPLFSPLPDGAPVASIDRLDAAAFNAGDRRYYEAPTLSGACAAVRNAVLAEALSCGVGGLTLAAMLAGLARHARRAGGSCVVLDHLCVSDPAASPSVTDDAVERNAFMQHNPLGALRRTLTDAAERGLPKPGWPGLEGRPVRLHVMHYWGGGVERWVRDIARADPGAIHLTLATYRIGEDGGQRVELRTAPDDPVPVRTWDLAQPLRTTSAGSVEYRRLLGEVIADFSVDSVIVSSLIGHGLDALETGTPTLVVLHDLYPVCQAINPRFRGRACQRCTHDDLLACQAENPLNQAFRATPADDWLALREGFVQRLLRARPDVVVPSDWVARTLRSLEPRLEALPMSVIGHGIDERPPRLAHPERRPGERLRLAVVGRMSPAKGPELLASAAEGLAAFADVWLVGEGKASATLAERCGWAHLGGYRPETLRDVLAPIAPHAAILPSVVPETFSYTLSELLNLGVAPLATNLGSFAERIRHGDNGFLFEPDPHHLVALVRTLFEEPQRLPEVAARLAASPPEPTTSAMVSAYRPWLRSEALSGARYVVGVGTQTGLSEPYRHLSQAFTELQASYGQVDSAWRQTSEALQQTQEALQQTQVALGNVQAAHTQTSDALKVAESTRDEERRLRELAEGRLAAIRAEWTRWMGELTGLRLAQRPWLLGRALAMLREGRARLYDRIHDQGGNNP